LESLLNRNDTPSLSDSEPDKSSYGVSSFELNNIIFEVKDKIKTIDGTESLFLKELESNPTVINKIKHLIIVDPEVYKNSGNLNVMEISRKLNIPYNDTLVYVESIRQEYSL